MSNNYQDQRPPEALWLQWYEDSYEPFFDEDDDERDLVDGPVVAHPDDRTYADERVFEHDVEYTRADIAQRISDQLVEAHQLINALMAERRELLAEIERLNVRIPDNSLRMPLPEPYGGRDE